jgi:hypothetical protein
VPLDRKVSYAEIAATAGLDEDHVRRILRHAITNRLFADP